VVSAVLITMSQSAVNMRYVVTVYKLEIDDILSEALDHMQRKLRAVDEVIDECYRKCLQRRIIVSNTSV